MVTEKQLYFFTGASGVGKSTLLNEINKWDNFKTIELSARPYLPKNNKDYVKNSSDEIQYLVNYGTMVTIVDSIINEANTNLFYSRCGIDRLAYSRALKVGDILKNITKTDIKNTLSNSTIFYIPIEFKLDNNDPLRGKNELIRNKVDTEIKEILKNFNIDYIEVKGTVKQRLEIIKNNLKIK